jgi:hypothetical protein
MKFLLLISLLSLNAFSEEYPPMKDEYKNIEDMISKLENDVQTQDDGTNANVGEKANAATTNTASAKAVPAKAVPVKKTDVVVVQTQAVQAPEATVVAVAPEPAATPKPEPVTIAQSQPSSDLPQQDEVKSYIDERPGKKYNKQVKVIEGLSGPSVYTAPTRDSAIERDDVYHYSFMPPTSNDGYNEDGIYDGKFGQFVLTVFGDYVLHYKGTTNRNTWGGDVQLGWQFPLEPFAIAILLDGGVRGSNTPGVKMFGLGPRVRASVRASSWIFPYLEGGLEFAKLESMNRWVYPYTVISGGVMFRFGKADRKAEWSLHRDYEVAQVLLIIGGDILTSPELNAMTPDNALIKFGISVEFF